MRELVALMRKHGTPQAAAERVCIKLAAASGLKNKETAGSLVCAPTRWGLGVTASIEGWKPTSKLARVY